MDWTLRMTSDYFSLTRLQEFQD